MQNILVESRWQRDTQHLELPVKIVFLIQSGPTLLFCRYNSIFFCKKNCSNPTIFIDFWLANMCFSNVQNILQSSPDGNVTLSILNYVPSIRDAGKYMACRAENSELPDATLEDGWKLEIHCKIFTII